jgi:hypothetical protein
MFRYESGMFTIFTLRKNTHSTAQNVRVCIKEQNITQLKSDLKNQEDSFRL